MDLLIYLFNIDIEQLIPHAPPIVKTAIKSKMISDNEIKLHPLCRPFWKSRGTFRNLTVTQSASQRNADTMKK